MIKTLEFFQKMSGGEVFGFNNAVFLSEREAADRNYALGFYMRENKCFPEKTNLRECMDFYFQVIAINVHNRHKKERKKMRDFNPR